MALLQLLFAWASLPFTVILGIALGFAVLQMSGVLGLLAGGGDHDHDGSTDAHVEAEADAHVEAEGDADGDTDHDADESAPAGGLGAALGVGKVPLSLLGLCFSLSFALTGLALNALILGRVGSVTPFALLGTLPAAVVVGLLCTRAFGRTLGKVFSDPAHEASTLRDLVGSTAVVISSRVDRQFGEIRLKDKAGNVVRIVCELHEDEPAVLEGKEVVVVDVDDARKRLLVSALDPQSAGKGATPRERTP